MVVRFDDHIIVGNQHLFAAHDGADGGAFRQVDILDGPAHHFRGFAVPVGNRLDGFCRPPAQGVHVDHIATAHMAEQAADGGLLGRDGDVDIVALDQIHIGRVGNQRHHLARPQPFGQQ